VTVAPSTMKNSGERHKPRPSVRRGTWSTEALHQLSRVDAEHLSELQDVVQEDVALAPLDLADVAPAAGSAACGADMQNNPSGASAKAHTTPLKPEQNGGDVRARTRSPVHALLRPWLGDDRSLEARRSDG
jgi:hypothetical protein